MERHYETSIEASDDARDNLGVVMALGILAYLSADLAHHLLGHGVTCLALGGKIVLLSSIFVDCTVRGSAVDLAGPLASLMVGFMALGAARYAHHRSESATRLFLVLAAGFNLLWFWLQLVFSAATRTDDFAWGMQEFHVSEWLRYGLIAAGGLGYLWSVRAVAAQMAGFATPRARARRIVLTGWLVAGGIACLTAVFDRHPIAAIVQHAAPQSFLLSIGLLFVPGRAAKHPAPTAHAIGLSIPWLLTASVGAAASIALLGPGISI